MGLVRGCGKMWDRVSVLTWPWPSRGTCPCCLTPPAQDGGQDTASPLCGCYRFKHQPRRHSTSSKAPHGRHAVLLGDSRGPQAAVFQRQEPLLSAHVTFVSPDFSFLSLFFSLQGTDMGGGKGKGGNLIGMPSPCFRGIPCRLRMD